MFTSRSIYFSSWCLSKKYTFSRNLTVIEVFGSWVVPYYFSLAKALGFQYDGLGLSLLNLTPGGTIQYSNIIDVAKLLVFIAKMQEIRLANRVE